MSDSSCEETHNLTVEKARSLLSSSLTEEDQIDLIRIKQTLNEYIRWGKVADKVFGPILKSMENIIFNGEENLVKNKCNIVNFSPTDMLYDSEREFLEEGDKAMLRSHYIVVLFTKKLLGVLKTKLNQHLKNIRILNFEEEFEALCEIEDEELIKKTRKEDEEFSNQTVNAEFSIEGNSMQPVQNQGIVDYVNMVGNWNCKHVRTKAKQINSHNNSSSYLETYCKDCHTVVKRVYLKTFIKKNEVCQHRYAEWVEGKEGKIARCADKVGCVHHITEEKKLNKIKWESVGLEPYGDDPSKDEIIIL